MILYEILKSFERIFKIRRNFCYCLRSLDSSFSVMLDEVMNVIVCFQRDRQESYFLNTNYAMRRLSATIIITKSKIKIIINWVLNDKLVGFMRFLFIPCCLFLTLSGLFSVKEQQWFPLNLLKDNLKSFPAFNVTLSILFFSHC